MLQYFLLLFGAIRCGQVFSGDLSVTYKTNGNVNSIRLLFSLESGLRGGQFISINNPTNTGSYTSAVLYVNVSSNGLVLGDSSTLSILSLSSPFFLQTQQDIARYQWLVLELFTSDNFFSSYSGLIVSPLEVYTASTQSVGRIIYDMNTVFGQVYIQPHSLLGSMAVSVVGVMSTLIGATNTTLTLRVTPGSAVVGGVIIYVEILGTGQFYFISPCNSTLGACYTDSTRTYLAQVIIPGDITASQSLTITLSVCNPFYALMQDLRVSMFKKYMNNAYGAPIAHVDTAGVFSTQYIGVTQDAKFYVGNKVAYNPSASTASLLVSQFNQVWLGWTVNVTFPPTQTTSLSVFLNLNADQVVPYSFAHNFIAAVGKVVTCTYSKPNVTCTGISTFIASTPYYVTCRALWNSAPSAAYTLGQLGIGLLHQGQYIMNIYTMTAGYATAPSEYVLTTSTVDWNGYATALADLQVISVTETWESTLQRQYAQVFPISGVPLGIQVNGEQMSLLFFIYNPLVSTTYGQVIMNIYFNSQVLLVTGASTIEYSTGTSYTITSSANAFTMTCGDATLSALPAACNIFRGASEGDYMAIRNVALASTFTNYPLRASTLSLDFLVVFTLVGPTGTLRQSVSTIPGYTITEQNVAPSLQWGYLNFQYSNTNPDSPTMLRIQGSLPIAYAQKQVVLFLDAGISLEYLDTDESGYACNIGSTFCNAYSTSYTTNGGASVMYFYNSMLTLWLTQDFQLLLPIGTTTIPHNFLHMGVLEEGGALIGVFTLYGPPSYAQSTTNLNPYNVLSYLHALTPVVSTDVTVTTAPMITMSDSAYNLNGAIVFECTGTLTAVGFTSGMLMVSRGAPLFDGVTVDLALACLTMQWLDRYGLYCEVDGVALTYFQGLEFKLQGQQQPFSPGQVALQPILKYSFFYGSITSQIVKTTQIVGEPVQCYATPTYPALRSQSARSQNVYYNITLPYPLSIDSTQMEGYASFVVTMTWSQLLPFDYPQLSTTVCSIYGYNGILLCQSRVGSSSAPLTLILTITTSGTVRLQLQFLTIALTYTQSSMTVTSPAPSTTTYTVAITTPYSSAWMWGPLDSLSTTLYTQLSSCSASKQVFSINASNLTLATFASPDIHFSVMNKSALSDFSFKIALSTMYDSVLDTMYIVQSFISTKSQLKVRLHQHHLGLVAQQRHPQP